jgi:hypothetical protein
MSQYVEQFVAHYIECALWSSNDESDERGGKPLDENYGPDDLAPEARAGMERECASFIAASGVEGSDNWNAEQAGHDFWLTRNGHGAGFWDRGHGAEGDALSKVAKSYGSSDLYIGDDGLLYVS